MQILLIEDDSILGENLEDILLAKDFQVDWAIRGTDGLEKIDAGDYNIITLDLGLPDMPGLDVIKEIRSQNDQIPILVLSGRTEVETRMRALEIGADDYLIKPFHAGELVARLNALLRRTNGHRKSNFCLGSLKFDAQAKEILVKGQSLELTRKEYGILELLCLQSGGIVSKPTFIEHLYPHTEEQDTKIIDVFIHSLRKKISAADADNAPQIQTVWGRGYRLSLPEG